MIQRRAYIRRTKPMPRASAPIPRRKRVKAQRTTPRAALARKCAALWSRLIAPEGAMCFMRESNMGPACSGRIDAAHVFGKGAHPGVRYERWNGVPLCRAHHDHYTAHPTVWLLIFRVEWGRKLYAERLVAASKPGRDLADVRAELEAA